MSCCADSLSWFTAPVATTTTRTIATTYFKPSAISCYVKNQADSTSSSSSGGSYRRRWYNPLRRRHLTDTPDIQRHWIEANVDSSIPSQERFTVLSYNILGDKNALKHRDLYRNVPSIYLTWDYRKRIICEELIGRNPDLICLQEVDRYFDLSKIMDKAGYMGSYKRRTGGCADGCAIFWKADKFHLLEAEGIEFKQYGLRDNVAQILVFEMSKAEPKGLLIGNIHVLYNPSRGDVKLGQIRFLSSRANRLSEKWGNAPLVLAGDYNSTPQSPIYNFLSSSELNIMLHDRRELSGQRSHFPSQVLGVRRERSTLFVMMDRFLRHCWTDEEVKVATGDTECQVVVHPLRLRSSYATVKGPRSTRGSSGEPLATSHHSKFLGTVDYLWYTDGLLPTRVLDTIPIDVLKQIGGLPCEKLGSDHLALASEFGFMQGTKEDKSATTSAKMVAAGAKLSEVDGNFIS